MQKTEKCVLRRTDHNSHMSAPHYQIRGLRPRYSLKSFDPVIEIVRAGIRIGKTGTLVDRVHQVRAIMLCGAPRFGIERRGNDGQTIVPAQYPHDFAPNAAVFVLLNGARCFRSPRLLFRPHSAEGEPAEQGCDRGLSRHHAILMPIPLAAEVTFVQHQTCAGAWAPPPVSAFLTEARRGTCRVWLRLSVMNRAARLLREHERLAVQVNQLRMFSCLIIGENEKAERNHASIGVMQLDRIPFDAVPSAAP